jgi:thymidylate kinase
MGETQKTVPGGLVAFFEGIDGVGKTTQLELAAKELRDEGWGV